MGSKAQCQGCYSVLQPESWYSCSAKVLLRQVDPLLPHMWDTKVNLIACLGEFSSSVLQLFWAHRLGQKSRAGSESE